MFKAADRVRVVANKQQLKERGVGAVTTGETGIITYCRNNNIRVVTDSGEDWEYYERDLELVEPAVVEPERRATIQELAVGCGVGKKSIRTFESRAKDTNPKDALEVKKIPADYSATSIPKHMPISMVMAAADEGVTAAIRTFEGGTERVVAKEMESYTSGATRTACETKIDPEGFFSPLVIMRYSEYMHKCRVQADGTLRDSDNWQGGIPLWRYMKGKWRHFLDTWLMHRGYKKVTAEGLDIQDCLCAELFNTMGYLHVMLCAEKGIESVIKDLQAPAPGGAHKNFKDRTAPTEGEY